MKVTVDKIISRNPRYAWIRNHSRLYAYFCALNNTNIVSRTLNMCYCADVYDVGHLRAKVMSGEFARWRQVGKLTAGTIRKFFEETPDWFK